METKEYQELRPLAGSSTSTAPLNEDRYAGLILKDRYLIDKKLGAGGIGEVYLARDRQLHSRQVVVKVLLEKTGQDEWFKKKFRQEIEALARIDHPGVVGVLDAGNTPDGKPFLVMQYVKGRTLRSMIKKDEGMDFEQVATITRQAARALSAAHDQGVLHCDLKPDNIMVQELGEGEHQVKIVDFGIAKIRDSQVESGPGHTRAAGTLPYMAPEQIQGRPSTASDIFSLGIIAYEMLTGRRPFNPPANQYQALEALRSGVRVKPKDLREELPPYAQQIILKALSFDAGKRYSRARDFGELLGQALTTDFGPPPDRDPGEGSELEMAHVLFMDIVGYSKLPSDDQTKIYKQLQQIISAAETFQRAKAGRQIISRSTGDGMALVFFSGPKAPVECAIEIARSVRKLPEVKLRMGINSGPVYRVRDANQMEDVAGAGINMAQRVMDWGDADHILLSKSVADVLNELGDWRSRIHDLGERKVKHGARLHLYNLQFGDIGNPRLPEKIRNLRKSLFVTMTIGLIALLLAAAAVWSVRGGKAPDNNPPSKVNSGNVVSAEAERVLAYSFIVQKFQGERMVGGPQHLADATISFEPKYQVKVNVATSQPGYLYVLNEPSAAGYRILYPSDTDKGKGTPTRIVVPEREDRWFQFDNRAGTETLWLVWSENPVSELESVKEFAIPGKGEIRDSNQSRAIKEMLARYSNPRPSKETDEKETTLKWQGNAIAYPLSLHHQ
jgi:serine/threonine protein kinase